MEGLHPCRRQGAAPHHPVYPVNPVQERPFTVLLQPRKVSSQLRTQNSELRTRPEGSECSHAYQSRHSAIATRFARRAHGT